MAGELMANGLHTIRINGEEFVFNVVNDLTEPCPQCGVPACGREVYLWKEKDDQKITLVFDGGLFGVFGSEFFTKHSEVVSAYGELPQFLRDWNEGPGWDEGDTACSISIQQLLQSLEIMNAAGMPDQIQNDFSRYCTAMTQLVETQGRDGAWYILKT